MEINSIKRELFERERNPKREKNEDVKSIKDNLEKLKNALKKHNLKLETIYDRELNITYIEVIDRESGEVIRKIPTEHSMKWKKIVKDIVEDLNSKISNLSKDLDTIKFKEQKSEIDIESKELILDINNSLESINDSTKVEYINGEFLLIKRDDKSIIGTLSSSNIKALNSKIREMIGIIGLIFDRRI